ncbi:MAG: sulfur globule protein precursor [Bradyrhizobium sp.]|uniref:sulfur globule protein precursor n=1 Tax=Bradyrhizobium sp. TaxID=376 RepID=UPI00271D5677|nr:sulfur globule protein precursor [Bradyrhizobium sp.]MDO9565072.1 sulfur globule protein precursor [Bradyrhizobium sp.]MDP3692283.1 sulfur globule protein precursor [Bradyrhizobium sp.]
MLRKISFAVITAIALGAAAMSPAAAGGKGGHGHGHGKHMGHGHGGHHGHGLHKHRHVYGGPAFYIGGDCYRYIHTRRGLRLVNVCVF